MSNTLLATKFFIPPSLPHLVQRERLLSRLNEGIQQGKRLTLISAPAGYGKTTLLAEWLRQSQYPAIWLTLDDGDNDPVRFLTYLISDLQKYLPGLTDTALAELKSSQTQIYLKTLAPVLNELAEIQGHFLIVFDDYHFINREEVHDVLALFIEHAPPQVHIVIASRADPLLPIARLRGRGQVNELRQNDLRFTREEATEFLRFNPKITLTNREINALANRTEGWAAGLQMAAASLENQSDIPAFIEDFTGSNRYILDYLIEEVLENQSLEIQEFLLHTSILDQICSSLCASVIEGSLELTTSSQIILEELEHKNLFIIPLDDRREWYRYHRLFSDLLRKRLAILYPGRKTKLHQHASRWYENEGFIEDAIEHAIAAGDLDRAANLIECAAETTLMQSQVTTYLHWTKQLPLEEIHNRPALSVYYSWALLWSGAPLEAIEALMTLTAKQHGHSIRALPLEAFLEIFNGDVSRAATLARQAIEALPPEDKLLRDLSNFILASSYLAQGKNEQGVQILERIARESERAGNVMIAGLVLCELGDESQKYGRLHEAHRLYQQALNLATSEYGQRLPVAGKALIGLGDLAREWNDFESAERYLTDGIKLAEQWSVLGTFEGYLNLVMLRDSQGRKQEADQVFSQLRDIAYQFDASEIDDYVVDMYAARRNIGYGDLESVQKWAEEHARQTIPIKQETSAVEDILRSRLRKYENTILARLYIAQGKCEDAARLLEQSLAEAKEANRVHLAIDAEILRALAFQKITKSEKSLEAITHALTLAEPGGYMRIFLDHGDQMVALLKDAFQQVDSPVIRSYIKRLLEAYQTVIDKSHPTFIAREKLDSEPLSDRELEVLHLLTSSMSSTEMAGELSVSVNTLRSHLKSIYAKLGVHSRYEAIAQAKDSGLI
ncbi:MAG: tetratricopeptide repeat protein [Chloroflexota bacterium]|nr:MAG: tetratricopeptide repeat protein [Chloroflexota bacterium]